MEALCHQNDVTQDTRFSPSEPYLPKSPPPQLGETLPQQNRHRSSSSSSNGSTLSLLKVYLPYRTRFRVTTLLGLQTSRLGSFVAVHSGLPPLPLLLWDQGPRPTLGVPRRCSGSSSFPVTVASVSVRFSGWTPPRSDESLLHPRDEGGVEEEGRGGCCGRSVRGCDRGDGSTGRGGRRSVTSLRWRRPFGGD